MEPPFKPFWIDARHISAREDLVDLSHYANKTERDLDMAEAMKRVVDRGMELDFVEKELFFHAYRKLITQKRFSWQMLTEIIKRTEGCDKKAIAALTYREQIEEEIRNTCHIVLKMVSETLLPLAKDPESMVFYFKMLGDYNRYLCEIIDVDDTEERENQIKITIDNYEKALFHAEHSLDISNATRLSVVMNYGVFYQEIKGETQRAINMLMSSFNMALEKIEIFEDPQYKDTVVVLQLMKDNVTLWLFGQDVPPTNPDQEKEEELKKGEGKSPKKSKEKSPKKSSSPKKKK